MPPKNMPSDDLESGVGGGCCGPRKKATKKGATIVVSPSAAALVPPTAPVAVAGETIPSPYEDVEHESVGDEKVVAVLPTPAVEVSSAAEKPKKLPHETIGHTGVRKVVIEHEEHEFSLDLSERF